MEVHFAQMSVDIIAWLVVGFYASLPLYDYMTGRSSPTTLNLSIPVATTSPLKTAA